MIYQACVLLRNVILKEKIVAKMLMTISIWALEFFFHLPLLNITTYRIKRKSLKNEFARFSNCPWESFLRQFCGGESKKYKNGESYEKIPCRTASPKIKDKAIPGGSIKSFLLKLKNLKWRKTVFRVFNLFLNTLQVFCFIL